MMISIKILKNEELQEKQLHLKVGRQVSYAFQSHAWGRRSEFCIIELQKVRRQENNDGLVELLNSMREAQMEDFAYNHSTMLSALRAPLPLTDDGIVPTKLHSANKVVDKKRD
jgi:hypothetical protein